MTGVAQNAVHPPPVLHESEHVHDAEVAVNHHLLPRRALLVRGVAPEQRRHARAGRERGLGKEERVVQLSVLWLGGVLGEDDRPEGLQQPVFALVLPPSLAGLSGVQ